MKHAYKMHAISRLHPTSQPFSPCTQSCAGGGGGEGRNWHKRHGITKSRWSEVCITRDHAVPFTRVLDVNT